MDGFLYSVPELMPFSSVHNPKLYLALCTEIKKYPLIYGHLYILGLYDFQIPSAPLCLKVSMGTVTPLSLLQLTFLPSLLPSLQVITSNMNAVPASSGQNGPLERVVLCWLSLDIELLSTPSQVGVWIVVLSGLF